jgi:hypothetical protein
MIHDPVDPVANPHDPTANFPGAEIPPLQASDGITLFAGQVEDFNLFHFAHASGLFRIPAGTVNPPTCQSPLAVALAYSLGFA